MKKYILNGLLWLVVLTGAFLIYNRVNTAPPPQDTLAYSDFIIKVKNGLVDHVEIAGQLIKIRTTDGQNVETYNPGDANLIDDLMKNNVQIRTTPPAQRSLLMDIFISWFPMLLLIAVWIIYMRRMQGAGGGANTFGKSKAKMLEEDKMTVTFDDVAGCEEAKEEVTELVDFLSDPQKFQKLGGKIPRGILMVGPPGTGKTLIARAIAGEAGVKFFTISGSDFVEMFVGVGASRVRDMFAQAKEHAPCIIFIDEIDAVGRQRGGAGMGGGNDEREQTLNQLLVEMDGFNGNEGVIVIAATNRADILDKALLRPGRFDRQVNVGLPDVRGREQILNVHIKKVPVAADVELKYIARGTPGFSGAELANVVNEAALFAARSNKKEVTMQDLEKAKDKILMGAERRTMVMSEDDKLLTAYHEAGHCIVGQLSPDHDPVYKVSIMPRGRALGITMFLPEQDQYSASKRKLESQIASLFGGRIAELMIYGGDRVTTGASNDIERATELARNMVKRWGFSDKLGPLVYGEEQGQPFMGYPGSQGSSVSNNVAQQIDEEIRAVIDRNYQRAETLLQENITILHKMADALMKWETIDKDQIDAMMAGKDPMPPKDDNDTFNRPNYSKQDKVDTKPVTSKVNTTINTKPARQV
ncbi:ATP-dependent zinc metalloprotease FtsH [Methylovulum psychrotolerans]|uniref:ATP-dependent zinc metalloprotease FtsH n=1 Tax=Methylovulum psychrotolerans TaxID=1704499 RepID=A0A1Z4C241_9GAMM|nr:ATP-dependent zinc metalloprotease FtsH [Methylovulum psychrotolerans]ASF47570.1 cell division protein FtsH [Methylovulum psychrotolerans]MBT9099914.1 ATP-dependent zinc metalloprotease FtsH [Methylovulum psychrotolerans]POZ53107.1 ATP-dependent zinc metalloprotease FtsH [Methylovulum psychrotolerans]